MVEVKNRFEFAKAVVIDKENVILVKDPGLIKFLVKKCDIMPSESSNNPDYLCYNAFRMPTPEEIDKIIAMLKLIAQLFTAIASVIFAIKEFIKAIKSLYRVKGEGHDPATGMYSSLVFERR